MRTRIGIGSSASSIGQTVWYVDAVAGNDKNTGLTAITALKTKAEIIRRWGTNSPTLVNNVTITYLSPDVDNSDPGVFTPFFNSFTLTHTAPLPVASFTGALLVVSPKNLPGNQALTTTVTAISGALAPGMLIVNHTRGNTRALVVRDVGGGHWLLTQPLVIPGAAIYDSLHANVDTWANGDAISGYVPLAVNLAVIGGQMTSAPVSFGPCHRVQQLTIMSPGFADTLIIDGRGNVRLEDSVIQRAVSVNAFSGGILFAQFVGCAFGSLTEAQGSGGDQVQIVGGCIGFAGNALGGYALSSTTLVANVVLSVPPGSTSLLTGEVSFDDSTIYVDTGNVLVVHGQAFFAGASNQPCVYGPGAFRLRGTAYVAHPSFVLLFPLAGGIGFDGAATSSAYGQKTTGGLTQIFELALTPAALDAPAAPGSGFGGLAFLPGVGAYWQGAAP